jgi:uncharacterized membrane protein YgdD (TMEM256/DUF423 family)
MKKGVVISGAILIFVAIILGAFGAHALKEILSTQSLQTFETGVRYQMYMGIAILSLGFNYHRFRKKKFNLFFGFILSGTLLFSLSIYGLIWAEQIQLFSLKKILGPITPLGGTLMLIGWGMLIVQFSTQKEMKSSS